MSIKIYIYIHRSCQCILQIRAVPDDKGTAEPPANTAQESPPSAVAHPNRAGTPNSGRRNGSNDLKFEHPEVSWGDGYRSIDIYIYFYHQTVVRG